MEPKHEGSGIDWLKILLGALMIGGGFWIYTRFASAAPSPSPIPSPEPSKPKPPLSPSGSYEDPNLPGHEIFVPGGSTMPSSSASSSTSSALPAPGPNEIGLRRGKTYRARLQLSGFEKLGSREQIAQTFSGLGFSNVKVYMKASELPAPITSWPQVSPEDGARWAEGTWERADENIARPPQVVEAREVG